jgi:predicted unusual protein kinase regulating ubiquinone biosynthesis (AarF/ABC1/UbiB family)
MKEQVSIPKHKITRAVNLAQSGAKIGINIAKYKVKKALTGVSDRNTLDRLNAEETFKTFSKLKGGPLKIAQMLSIDQNIMPSAYVQEFQKSYYSAPALSYPLVVQTFRREFGKTPTQIFDHFSSKACAAASIGQVHKARIGKKDYAVKIQYPGVSSSLKSDLNLLKPFATSLLGLKEDLLSPYINEVEERLLEECNYELELERSIRLAKDSRNLKDTYFPNYYPDLSSDKIIVMDWVEGLTLDKFIKQNPDQALRNKIGQALWDFYHYQIHTLKQFHADPHPGNFIIYEDQLWVIDFGCVKSVGDDFYKKYFSLLDLERVQHSLDFESILSDLELIKVDDEEHTKNKLIHFYRQSVELLSKPYQSEEFDFGDKDYAKSIYAFSEKALKDKDLDKVTTTRGHADAIYVNRAFYGVYNLSALIGAKIKVRLPDFIHPDLKPY